MKYTASHLMALALTLLALNASPVSAQIVIQDDFNSGTSAQGWSASGGACLTAARYSAASGSSIPGCVGLPYYGSSTLVGNLPDASGSGALRLTDGNYNQAGAIISTFTFPNDSGVQVTFRTVTYHGDSGGSGTDGADGISFFLMDGSYPPYDVGAFGGSLGYTCSNANDDTAVAHNRSVDGTRRGSDGLAGAYLGLGIDEYGNFLNAGDNTATGFGNVPNRIGLRGAGGVAWAQLHALNPTYYPSSLYTTKDANGKYYSDSAVQNTCASGVLWDYSTPSSPKKTTTRVPDYTAIPNAYSVLPAGTKIANEAAANRTQATPIIYKLKITSSGLLSFAYSINGGAYNSVINSQSITAANGALPTTFRFGFAGSTGGSDNVHEILCFQAAPADTASSSAGLNQVQSAKLEAGAQVYFAYYNPTTWAGYLTASNLSVNPTNQAVTIASTANWDASCTLTGVLTGQVCNNTNVPGPTSATAQSARTLLTWSDTAASGIPFEWGSLTSTEQAALTAGDASPTANRVNYLRGDRSNEVTLDLKGSFRDRASVLGDIIDSSPAWVGPPSAHYNVGWQDALYGTSGPEKGGQAYAAFKALYATRQNVVYVGANDGFVHGFRAGGYDSNGNYVANSSTPNDGVEVLGYMPQTVLFNIHNGSDSSRDFSSPSYAHAFDIDAPPGTGDLYYSGAWHTWLVGGLGAGGAGIYALDITNPANFSESAAASTVIGDWTPATLTCANVQNCGANLGYTYGTPQVRRFHNGQWGFIFGNGFGSSTGNAGIYIMLQSATGGAPTFYYLQVPAGASANGIAYVTPADLDGDHITDYVYAGDLLGNVWRFDLTSNQAGNWSAPALPIFTTPAGKPITTALVVASIPAANSAPRVIVAFGTGQSFPQTTTAPTTYATGQQYIYGIWDWNMSAWNSLASGEAAHGGGTEGAAASTQYASLQGPQTVTFAKLEGQAVTGTYPPLASDTVSSGYRTVSSNPVCWAGSSSCTGGAAQFGFYLPLPATNEQIVYNPTLINGNFVVNTIIPPVVSVTSCQPATPTGWTMAISVTNGGTPTSGPFVDNNRNTILENTNVPISGEQLNGTGSVSVVNSSTLITQTASSVPTATAYNVGTNYIGKRVTWTQKR